MNKSGINHLFFTFLLFLLSAGVRSSFADPSEGKRVVQEFIEAIEENDISKAKSLVIQQDRDRLFQANKRISVRLYFSDYPLYELADRMGGYVEQGSEIAEDEILLFYRVHGSTRRGYQQFYLKNKRSWKIQLRKSIVHSKASLYLAPHWLQRNETNDWRFRKQVSYSTLNDCVGGDGYFVTGSGDGRIRLWDQKSSSSSDVLTDLPGPVDALDLSPDASKLMIRADTVIQLWDLDDREKQFQVQKLFRDNVDKRVNLLSGKLHRIQATDIHWETGMMLVGYQTRAGGHHNENKPSNYILHVWDIQSGNRVQTVTFKSGIQDVSLSYDGTMAGVVTEEEVRFWPVQNPSRKKTVKIEEHPKRIQMTTDPLSMYLLDGKTLIRYYPKSDAIRKLDISNLNGDGSKTRIRLFKDSERLAVYERGASRFVLVDGKRMELIDTVKTNELAGLSSVRIMDKDRLLIGTSENVFIKNIESGRKNKMINGFNEKPEELKLLKNGKRGLTFTDYRASARSVKFQTVIREWDLKREEVTRTKTFSGNLKNVALDSDDQLIGLALEAKDKRTDKEENQRRIVVLDRTTTPWSPVLDQMVKGVNGPLRFTSEGHLLYGHHGKKIVRMNPVNGKEINVYTVPKKYRDNKMEITAIQISPDQKFLLGGIGKFHNLNEGRGNVLVWNKQTGSFMNASKKLGGPVFVIAISATSDTLMVGSSIGFGPTIYQLPKLQKKYTVFRSRLFHAEWMNENVYLFDSGGGQYPHHILNVEEKMVFSLPGIYGKPASTIDLNARRNMIFGTTDGGALMLWEKR